MGAMAGLFLYSVNSHFSVQVSNQYRRGVFYAWCSECFSATQQPGLDPSSLVAPSSDPMVIYEQLYLAVAREDRHDSKIKGYKRTFKRLADEWWSAGDITKAERDEIITNCKQQSFRMWRPLLFVISRPAVETRLKKVPATKRAGVGDEFTIADLRSEEFDILELPILAR